MRYSAVLISLILGTLLGCSEKSSPTQPGVLLNTLSSSSIDTVASTTSSSSVISGVSSSGEVSASGLIGGWRLDSVQGVDDQYTQYDFEMYYLSDSLYTQYTSYPELDLIDSVVGKWWATDSIVITNELESTENDSLPYLLEGDSVFVIWYDRPESKRITHYFSKIIP